MKYTAIALLLLLTSTSFAQFKYYDYTYQDHIASVNVTVNDQITNIPTLVLNSTDYMIVTFDDLHNSEEDYFYRIIHCDRDWNKSEIFELDYLEGFNNEILRVWEFSQLTETEYTHFWIQLPNRDVRIKISGNYLLYIYQLDEDNEEVPILTRRFIYSEDEAKVSVEMARTTDSSLDRFFHQLDISSLIPEYVENPMSDITSTVIQNGMWTEAINNIKPFSVNGIGLRFDPFGSILFPGLREFRNFDTRILRGGGRGIQDMRLAYGKNEATLYEDLNLSRTPYLFGFDFNGKFVVDAFDAFRVTTREEASKDNIDFSERATFAHSRRFLDGEYTFLSKDIKADYITINFRLKSDPVDHDVYVYGALSDWALHPKYKMTYDLAEGVYKASVPLKQGFYDYMYAVDDNGKVDLSTFQGNWYNTEHEYTIITYFREFGTRYDRVLGVRRFSSFRSI